MITKKIAADLYGNGYVLQDKEGRVYSILELWKEGFMCEHNLNGSVRALMIKYDLIGTEYHILARPNTDIDKDIEKCNGPQKCSLVAYWNIAKSEPWVFKKRSGFLEVMNGRVNFGYNMKTNGYLMLPNHMVIDMQRLHFALDLPEGSWIPVTDNNNPYK